jgi:ribonuclease BN (tRNA processing enzyme)
VAGKDVAGLTVTVLGCDASYAGAAGACSGYLVRSPAATVWLDTGPGTLAQVQRHVPLEDLDAIVVSHEHPDHWLDLVPTVTALNHYVPRSRLATYGTAGTRRLLETVCDHADAALDWTTIDATSTLRLGDQDWRFSRTDHYVETLACRVESGGRSLIYSSDTGPGWTVAELGAADLVISEATFLSDREPHAILHLSARQAGLGARGCTGRLVLTHRDPRLDVAPHVAEAAEAFGAVPEVATVGAVFAV